MPISKEKKKGIFEDVTNLLSTKDSSVVFVNFHGMTVADVSLLRKKLKAEGVKYLVAKKSIVKKILRDMNIPGEMPELTGELAIASGGDSILPAREIYEFQKQMEGKIAILGGIFDGAYTSKDSMVAIASIPSLQTLRGMFVNLIASPMAGFVRALDAIAKNKTA